MNLTERQRDILFAIIEQYAELATPVGSVTLAKLFDVSSATIRSEMVKLESLGLIAQPHTSAGRIPTDAGYRFYVNSLVEESETEEPAPSAQVEPSYRPSLPEGSISRPLHVLEVRVSSHASVESSIKSAVNSLTELTGNLGLGTIGNQLYIAGISRLLTQPEFVDLSRVQAVAKLLDNLEPWLKEAAPGEPLNIFIGQENPIGKSSDVSLIISKFRSPFSDNSYIGVLGPTRQNYQKVMSLVRQAGKMLEKSF
ncbi:transcriptional regulator [Candidatus Saccharibacteria bacterium]|nr:transcriptional regulator [Candidatus Saccharibacteria bacterium]